MIINGSEAPLESNVATVGQAWNWALRTLARRGLAHEVAKLVYHVDFRPHASKMRLKCDRTQIGDTLAVGSAVDTDSWARAAWRLAIMLVGEITQRHGQQWTPSRDILAKAL